MLNTKIKKKKLYLLIVINTTLNNTFLTVSLLNSQKIVLTASTGSIGFKGYLKSKPYAATQLGYYIGQRINSQFSKMSYTITIKIKGFGYRRIAALRGLLKAGTFPANKIQLLQSTSVVPFNGCRPAKKRRL